jgi:predicted DNA-binding protein with PD1-like motif
VKSRQIESITKAFILVFETGELAKGLSQFGTEQRLSAASFKAVGALGSFGIELGIKEIRTVRHPRRTIGVAVAHRWRGHAGQ